MNSEHYVILALMSPVATALLVSFLGLLRPRWCYGATLMGLMVGLGFALLSWELVEGGKSFQYVLAGWQAPYGIELLLNSFNWLLFVSVYLFSVLIVIHSKALVRAELPDKEAPLFILILLVITGLSGMTVTGDAFNMFVMIEISSLATYALIAIAGGRAYVAALNYLFIGMIGGSLYLLGVGYLYQSTGTLNMRDLQRLLPDVYTWSSVHLGFGLMLLGLFIKMALVPFHGWLSNAYSNSPNVVANFLAPLSTKVAVFAMLRVMFDMFDLTFLKSLDYWQPIVLTLACVAIVFGSLAAFHQRNIRRCLTYVIISEIGYMVGGVWLLTDGGFRGSAYHLMNDLVLTASLFMCASTIYLRQGSLDFESLGGSFRTMPITMLAMCISLASLVGVPPTSGFVSKWLLVSASFSSPFWIFGVCLLFAGLVNVVIMFRIVEQAFFGSPAQPEQRESAGMTVMTTLPLVVSAGALMLIGLESSRILRLFIEPQNPFL